MADQKLVPVLEDEEPMSPDLALAFVRDGIITQADLDAGLVAPQHIEAIETALAEQEKK